MPISYQIQPEHHLIIVSYSGLVTIEQILQLRGQVIKDHDFNPMFDVLDDVTAVDDINFRFDDLSDITSSSAMQRNVKRALLAKNDFQFGMSRMYQVLSESAGYFFKVFRDRDQAMAWLKEDE